MDVRQLFEAAAGTVVPSTDLAERAERTYRRRVGRRRALAGVVALSSLGSLGVAVTIDRSSSTTITADTPELGPPVAIERLSDVYFLTASHAIAVTDDDAADIASSTDAGRHWNRVGALDNAAPVEIGREIVFINDDDGFVRAGGVLHLTHDGGRTWEAIDRSFRSIGPARVDETVWALAGCDDGDGCVPRVDISHDRGTNWRPARSQPDLTGDRHDIVGISEKVAYVSNPTGRVLWRTDNGATTWTPVALPCTTGDPHLSGPIQGALWVLCIDPARPQAYRSLDGGLTWTPTASSPPAPLPVHDFAALSDQAVVVTTVGGTIYATTDGGASWRQTLTLPGTSTGVLGVRSGMKVWMLTTANSATRGLWTSPDGVRWTRADEPTS